MAKKKGTPTVVAPAQPFKKVESVAGNDVPTYYVNNANIDLSTFDVRFRLGQIQGVVDSVLQVKEVAYVFMSHAHFRALVDAVNSSAKKLEQLPPPGRLSEDAKTH